jgi:branched-chain amino acid transport system substrate-binding protein
MNRADASNFDAILIPEGGATLDTILRGLNSRGVKPSNVKFLGTGLWDDAELLRRVNLESAWVASSPPELTSQFDARFRETYKYAPPRIASLTYDAVALTVTLATSGRAFDTPTLTNAGGFAGPANGIFRLRANGQVQRGLAVMQVYGGSLKVVSPAPSSF